MFYICAVAKRGAYILLFLFILHDSAFNQLLKLPALVSHYRYHVALNPNIDFGDFLSIHYQLEDDGDNDQELDKQLPYKHIDAHSLQQVFVPLAKVVSIKAVEYEPVNLHYPVSKDYSLPEPAVSSLFRPPQA